MAELSFSILVCSKNGGTKLERLLESIARQDAHITQTILLDDGSKPALTHPARKVQIVRFSESCGYIVSRNELARRATNEFMVFLDDDVVLDDPTVLRRAGEIMSAESEIGAVAFQQRDVKGNFLECQPLQDNHRRQIATYFGWTHLIRRSAWLKVGPFIEIFGYGYEESEFSLRLLDAGFKVIGDPALSVVHDVGSPSKNWPKRDFSNLRNVLLTIMLRYPVRLIPSWLKGVILNSRPHPLSKEPLIFFRLRLLCDLALKFPYVIGHRKPVSDQSIALFWQLQKKPF